MKTIGVMGVIGAWACKIAYLSFWNVCRTWLYEPKVPQKLLDNVK